MNIMENKIGSRVKRINNGEVLRLRINKVEDYIIEKIDGDVKNIVRVSSNMYESGYKYEKINNIKYIMRNGKEY